MSNGISKEEKLYTEYSELLVKYRNLLTTKIFEKSEQIKNEFRSFAKINGLNINAVPDSLQAYDGEKLKLKLTFLTPQAERAQAFLSVFFDSPKEFYLNIFHSGDPVKEIYPGEEINPDIIRDLRFLYDDLQMTDVYINYYDKDQLTDETEGRYSNFIDIIEQLYKAPRKF